MDNAHKSTLTHVRKNVAIIMLVIKRETTVHTLAFMYIYMIYVYT